MPQKNSVTGKAVGESNFAGGGMDPLIYMKKDEKTLIMAFRLLSEEDKKEITEKALLKLDNKSED